MTSINSTQLVVIIPTKSATEYRNWLIKAIAAAIRWKANYKNSKIDDEQNAEMLSDLLEHLADMD